MRALRIYQITEEQFKNTEYRPLDAEISTLETEDEWNYSDMIDNTGENAICDLVHECGDLYVWKVTTFDTNETLYIVELKEGAVA